MRIASDGDCVSRLNNVLLLINVPLVQYHRELYSNFLWVWFNENAR